MCGIAGIGARSPIERSALISAVLALKRRGPDDDGVFVDPTGKVGLGHTRLSIIDPSPAGRQPMASANGRYVISFNGEIYNFADLRADLSARGLRFRGSSDTEVLLEAYAVFGEAVLSKLNGIFAFAIHDSHSGELFVARDHLGVKPLYYADGANSVAFASEIKALVHIAPDTRDVDVAAVRRYLTFLWCPGERTPFAGVKKLGPGQAMVIRDGRIVRLTTYWRPPVYRPRSRWTASDCAEELRDRLNACVRRQMVSDVPVGSFLSGGLDSSAVVAAARHQAPHIQCFTIDTTEIEEGATDDLPYARAAAAHLGVDLHEVRIGAADLCGRIEEMVGYLDEPLADPACLNVLFISELARSHGIKVLLSGVGGDDLFTGYRRHAMLALEPLWGAVPSPLHKLLGSATSRLAPRSVMARRLNKALASAAMTGDQRVSRAFAWGPPGVADRLLSSEATSSGVPDDVFEDLDALLAEHAGEPLVEKCLELEKRFFLADHNLLYTDKMAMAAGVEVRVPLLDLEMVEFAAEIPLKWKLRGLKSKWIFRQAERSILPPQVISRPKSGFGGPLRRWMRGEMRDLVEDLLSPRAIRARGLFDATEVMRLREADARGEADTAYTLFSVMCIELWCRTFADASRFRPDHSTVRSLV